MLLITIYFLFLCEGEGQWRGNEIEQKRKPTKNGNAQTFHVQSNTLSLLQGSIPPTKTSLKPLLPSSPLGWAVIILILPFVSHVKRIDEIIVRISFLLL